MQNNANTAYDLAVAAATKQRDTRKIVAYDIDEAEYALSIAKDEHVGLLQEYVDYLARNHKLNNVLQYGLQYAAEMTWNEYNLLDIAHDDGVLDDDGEELWEYMQQAIDSQMESYQHVMELMDQMECEIDETEMIWIRSDAIREWDARDPISGHPDGEPMFVEIISRLMEKAN